MSILSPMTEVLQHPREVLRGKTNLRVANPFSPYSIQKRPKPQIRLWGFQSGGLKFEKICQYLSEDYRFSNFDKFLTNFSPPDWSPQKQSLGQILDKFGVSGVFECCKGRKGSQPKGTNVHLQFCRFCMKMNFLRKAVSPKCFVSWTPTPRCSEGKDKP